MLTLGTNDILLHNCMLDSRDFANIIHLKVMKKLGLNITWPYKMVCRFNSKLMEVEGLMKELRFSLDMNLDISLIMDVVVIDVVDVWGMLLSWKWLPNVGGHIQMDL